MKTLPVLSYSPEQLPLMSQNRFGVEVICGAAGSGKTTTALLRLRSLCHFFSVKNRRENRVTPVRVLVLTFNRTLAGYIRALVEDQVQHGDDIDLCIETFGRWAVTNIGSDKLSPELARSYLFNLASRLNVLTPKYVVQEVEYVLGRFTPENIEQYIALERTGRGLSPRVDRNLRRRIIDEIILPYKEWLDDKGVYDWNEVAISMARDATALAYDIVIVDESQDFSANQLRAIKYHLAKDHTLVFVIDTVQRIYARGFTWAEAGFDVRSERSHMLRVNYRNTKQIAAFVASVLDGIGVESDGVLPDLNAAISEGEKPKLLCGFYNQQVTWAINYIRSFVDLNAETVAFLKPRARGAWIAELERRLKAAGLPYVFISQEAEWPDGNENIAICSFHSAKGLEFDYVFILGLSDQNTTCASEDVDDELLVMRKLFAIAVARARKAVIIGHKIGEESLLVNYFNPETFVQVNL